ncbi:MAG: hypothetical protein LBP92_04490 [Deltaproteobacteria bacterium]|jgi:hypothetical protein|nr:hypothetical protein [Deltaproteobacteria bacterium]
MAFTEKELREQEQALEAAKEEFSRLNAQFDGMVKDAGHSHADLRASLEEKRSPELDKLLEQAREEATRAGQARAAQTGAPLEPQTRNAGRGRPGAVRI